MTASRKWVKISLPCQEKMSEAVSDLLGVLSGSGVEIHPDNSTGLNEISGFFAFEVLDDESGQQNIRDIQFKVEEELKTLFSVYGESMPKLQTDIFDDQEWGTSWQQYFKTFEIAPGLIIKPSWETFIPDENQHVLEMDPGMAFGTGQHESTRLALSMLCSGLKDSPKTETTVLDIGTGTGILAMASALFGGKSIVAIDNDPEAVAVAKKNVMNNHLSHKISVSATPLADIEGCFDLICANIVHDVLVEMAPQIARLLAPGGQLVLAGILCGPQVDNLTAVYRHHAIQTVSSCTEGEWAALLMCSKN